MSKKNLTGRLAIGVFAMAAALPASATLIGDMVTVKWLSPDTATTFAGPQTVTVVNPGVEISCPNAANALCNKTAGGTNNAFESPTLFNIGADTIFYQQNSRDSALNAVQYSNNTNIFEFSDLDDSGGGVINTATIVSNITGLDASRLTFGSDWVRVDMDNLLLPSTGPFDTSSTGNFTVSLTFGQGDPEPNPEPQPQPTTVPEPASLALLGIGFLGAGVARRRRKR